MPDPFHALAEVRPCAELVTQCPMPFALRLCPQSFAVFGVCFPCHRLSLWPSSPSVSSALHADRQPLSEQPVRNASPARLLRTFFSFFPYVFFPFSFFDFLWFLNMNQQCICVFPPTFPILDVDNCFFFILSSLVAADEGHIFSSLDFLITLHLLYSTSSYLRGVCLTTFL